jgi:CDP-glycerol glycerophosphotransferase (TagB/SpsB family)
MLDRRYRRAGINVVRDFADVCRQADLYITDNSSSLYEFAATGRPVVVLNAPWYRRDVHHGLRFWDAIPGPQVDHSRDLVPTVLKALETDTTDLRESALAKVYAYRSGAAERAARIIEEWV